MKVCQRHQQAFESACQYCEPESADAGWLFRKLAGAGLDEQLAAFSADRPPNPHGLAETAKRLHVPERSLEQEVEPPRLLRIALPGETAPTPEQLAHRAREAELSRVIQRDEERAKLWQEAVSTCSVAARTELVKKAMEERTAVHSERLQELQLQSSKLMEGMQLAETYRERCQRLVDEGKGVGVKADWPSRAPEAAPPITLADPRDADAFAIGSRWVQVPPGGGEGPAGVATVTAVDAASGMVTFADMMREIDVTVAATYADRAQDERDFADYLKREVDGAMETIDAVGRRMGGFITREQALELLNQPVPEGTTAAGRWEQVNAWLRGPESEPEADEDEDGAEAELAEKLPHLVGLACEDSPEGRDLPPLERAEAEFLLRLESAYDRVSDKHGLDPCNWAALCLAYRAASGE